MKKRVSWITAESFIDVDLPIINSLRDIYDIRWFIVIGNKASIDYESYVKQSLTNNSLKNISFIYLQDRARSPKIIKAYYNIIKQAKQFKPDFFYIAFYGAPYGLFLYKFLLPIKKCVVACHNVTTPKGASNENFIKRYTHLWLSIFKNIQVFSENQYQQLVSKFNGKNVLKAYLAIKDYGESQIKIDKENSEIIRFLFFGNILGYKRVDLLIEAANTLYEQGIRNFRIRIAGACKNWEKYQSLIKYPEIFELHIMRIPNESVADLFADSHYFVMPYQDIAQSGAITVAFRYNLPVICSNIQQFREFVKPETGYMFNALDSKSLAQTMSEVISCHKDDYKRKCVAEQEFVDNTFSLRAITNKYIKFFDTL